MNNEKIQIHEHGYIQLIETWGSDERIVEAARMSTDKGFVGWGTPDQPGDEKLLKYLWTNRHSSPFEMAGAIFEIQAPVFVFREWHRHRTQSFNEMSARYTPMPCLHYVPTVERLLRNSDSKNKQAGTIKGAKVLDEQGAINFRQWLMDHYEAEENLYKNALDDGVPKELARLPVSVARYSRMRASANLRNWLAFLTLRNDSHAQVEIQDYAVVVQDILSNCFTRTLEIFEANR